MDRTLPLMVRARAERYPELVAQYAKDAAGTYRPTTFKAFLEEICVLASGLLDLGVKRGDHVGLISDNRKEWFIADLGTLSIGAADVPRGNDSTEREIAYILGFSDCSLSFAENDKQAEKILSRKGELPKLSALISFDDPSQSLVKRARELGVELLSYRELMEMGAARRASRPGEIEAEMDAGNRDDLATIIFTSGTTGEPKGVMLSHGNFLHQLPSLPLVIDVKPGDVWLSVLPVWHSFERLVEYAGPYLASGIAYSKPIGAIMLADIADIKPQWMASVPRIWESVLEGVFRSVKQKGPVARALFGFFLGVARCHEHCRMMTFGLLPDFGDRSRALDALLGFLPWALLAPLRRLGDALVFRSIKAKLGGRFRAGISGGGALPARVDEFFSAVGVQLLEGYGLTETAPVVAVRRWTKPRPHCVGLPVEGTEIRIVDEQGQALPPGKMGTVMVRGGQVMRGYYKREEETARILSPDGWLNTGDLGMMTRDGELKLTGRAKDTIVLRGGENVEPCPVEEKLRESEWISQCMLVGQDQKYLGALIVPRQEQVLSYAKENGLGSDDYASLLETPEIANLLKEEVDRQVCHSAGFKSFERVCRIKLLAKPFEAGVELSAKQDLMRHRIAAIYEREIGALFGQ